MKNKPTYVKLISTSVDSAIYIPDLEQCKEDISNAQKQLFIFKLLVLFEFLLIFWLSFLGFLLI